jgi:hypothetical protein
LSVTGVVTDEKGLPLAGVTVAVKGTTQGVVTDINGKFTLLVKDPNASLVFSFIGYTRRKLPLTVAQPLMHN